MCVCVSLSLSRLLFFFFETHLLKCRFSGAFWCRERAFRATLRESLSWTSCDRPSVGFCLGLALLARSVELEAQAANTREPLCARRGIDQPVPFLSRRVLRSARACPRDVAYETPRFSTRRESGTRARACLCVWRRARGAGRARAAVAPRDSRRAACDLLCRAPRRGRAHRRDAPATDGIPLNFESG